MRSSVSGAANDKQAPVLVIGGGIGGLGEPLFRPPSRLATLAPCDASQDTDNIVHEVPGRRTAMGAVDCGELVCAFAYKRRSD